MIAAVPAGPAAVIASGAAIAVGEIGGGMVRPGRVQLAAAVGSSPVVVPGVLGQGAAQVAFAEDQHPVGELGPGGVHEPFRMRIRARAPGRGLPSLDARAGRTASVDAVHCPAR